jgi:hypothetical protein
MLKSLKGQSHFTEPGTNNMIILKVILHKYYMTVWIGLRLHGTTSTCVTQ